MANGLFYPNIYDIVLFDNSTINFYPYHPYYAYNPYHPYYLYHICYPPYPRYSFYPYTEALFTFRAECFRPESNFYTAGASNSEEILVLVMNIIDENDIFQVNRFLCNALVANARVLDMVGFQESLNAQYWIKTTFELQISQDCLQIPLRMSEYNRLIISLQVRDKIIEALILRQIFEFESKNRLMGIVTDNRLMGIEMDNRPMGIETGNQLMNFETDNRLTGTETDNRLTGIETDNGLTGIETDNRSTTIKRPSIWQRLAAEANKANVPVETIKSFGKKIQVAEGTFKLIFHAQDDDSYVIQNFKEISEGTLETRVKEAICCLKTKGVSNTGQIRSIYKDDKDDELVGISMMRYSYTLKEYAFRSRNSLTGEQKYYLIHDMIKGIMALHDAGFAHRDLSEVNMMVNFTNERLLDGSFKPELVVIDFGKAEFVNRDDILAWSVDEVPNSQLEILPLIRTVPDHGYKLYRSAATLPRTKNDHEVMQDPINPCSEDVYAVGVLAWRIFSGQLPWGGILDTDLKKLRGIISNPEYIKFYIERDVRGIKSRELLYKCITATPRERSTARQLLDWLLQAKKELISEWTTSGRRIQ